MTTTPLDKFRRHAKELRKAHEDNDPQAVMRIAAHPPRPSDDGLKHADYLHVIAQEHSHNSWPEMKAAIETLGLDRADKQQRLKIALLHGQAARVQMLLAEDPDLAGDALGLLVALYDRPKVEALIAADPSLAVTPLGPRTAMLHLAGSPMFQVWPEKQSDMFAIGDLLLAQGADVNDAMAQPRSDHKLSALYLALSHAGNVALARWLLENGANPNDGESLYHATEMGHRDGLRLLLMHGADPKGTNALPRAMDFHDHEAVQMLLDAGADPNECAAELVPALHHAARRLSDARMVSLLLSAGADPAQTWQGTSAYVYACVYGNNALRQRLAVAGKVPELTPSEALMAKAAQGEDTTGLYVDPETLSEEFRNIMCDLAVMPDRLEHVQRLVALGLEYDRPNKAANIPPIQAAGWEGLLEMMTYLLSLRPDMSHVNGYGGTLLTTIIHGSENCPDRASRDHVTCALRLLEYGVALPRRAVTMAADPAMAAALRDWAAKVPGSVVEGELA